IPGERVTRLAPLAVPDASSLDVDSLLSCRSVELFVERARAVRPSFVVDEANAAAVRDICRRLDGLPLSLELAAARLEALRVGEIVELLDDRFRLLASSGRTVTTHQHTLRATVEWSFNLLNPAERLVFVRLSVFAAGFDAAAASAVMRSDGIEPLDVLDALGS